MCDGSSPLDVCSLCSLCLWRKSYFYISRAPKNKIPLEADLCNTLLYISASCHLCCLARFSFWFKCLSSIIHLNIQKIHLILIDGADFSIFRWYPYVYDDDFSHRKSSWNIKRKQYKPINQLARGFWLCLNHWKCWANCKRRRE